MVVLNKIYTRTGDAGETALGNGARVAKFSARVAAYGTVDETNATVGLARLHASGDMDLALARIQNDLFDLGADLCRPDMAKDAEAGYPVLRMIEPQVLRLEGEIDAMNAPLAALRSFIPAGGKRACGASASVPHRVAPRREAGCGTGDGGRGERLRGQISQPPVGLVLRCGPGRERGARCPLGAGCKPIGSLVEQFLHSSRGEECPKGSMSLTEGRVWPAAKARPDWPSGQGGGRSG